MINILSKTTFRIIFELEDFVQFFSYIFDKGINFFYLKLRFKHYTKQKYYLFQKQYGCVLQYKLKKMIRDNSNLLTF